MRRKGEGVGFIGWGGAKVRGLSLLGWGGGKVRGLGSLGWGGGESCWYSSFVQKGVRVHCVKG